MSSVSGKVLGFTTLIFFLCLVLAFCVCLSSVALFYRRSTQPTILLLLSESRIDADYADFGVCDMSSVSGKVLGFTTLIFFCVWC